MKNISYAGKIATLLTAIVLVLYVAVLWLSVPFFQSSGGIALWHSGFAESLSRSDPFKYPPHIGLPLGAPIVFGASISYSQYILMRVFGIDGIESYAIVGLLFSMIAVWGCYSLARSFGIGKLLSAALTIAFLSQVFFSVHIMGYGATGFGLALLPAFGAVMLHIIRMPVSRSSTMLSGILLTVAMIFLAFLDGYALVMSLAIGVAILTGHALVDRRNWQHYLTIFVLLCVSALAAVSLYKLYVPVAGFPVYPARIFAILSVNIPSLIWPTAGYSILFDHLGWSTPRPVTSFAGAGLGNHETVFLSITALVTGAVTIFLRVSRTWKIVALLLIIGSLVMAIGPVVQLGEEEGFAKTPVYPLYKLPGLDQMRATYRWVAVVKLGLWILLCLACARLASFGKFGTAAAFALVLLVTLEGSANPIQQWKTGERLHNMAVAMKKDLVDDLKERVPPNSKLLFLPVNNDFAIHAIAAIADVYTYNVAGDKNLLIAESVRPYRISRIAKTGPCLAHDLHAASRQGEIDFLAFPLFDNFRPRRGWVWPPSMAETDGSRTTAIELSSHLPKESLVKGKYFWFVDARQIDRPSANGQCKEEQNSLLLDLGKRVEFTDQGDGRTFLLKGWSYPEPGGTWSEGREAEIRFQLSAKPASIIIEATPLVSPSHLEQNVEISINGVPAITARLTSKSKIVVPVPESVRSDMASDDVLSLGFKFPDAARPYDLGLNDDKRVLALALHALTTF